MAQEQGHVDLLEIYHARSLFHQIDVQIRRVAEQKRRPKFHDPITVDESLNHYRALRQRTLQLLKELGDTHAIPVSDMSSGG